MRAGRYLLVVALFGGSGFAVAHHGRLQEHLLKVDVVSAGRYTDTGAGFIRTAGHAPVSSPATLIEAADQVPMRVGERFGFCFEATGFLEDGEADLQKIVTHPSRNAGTHAVDGFVQEVELTVSGGKASGCVGHVLGAEDLIAGRWTIALGSGETTLVERSFELR
jgi:hypothetical protein